MHLYVIVSSVYRDIDPNRASTAITPIKNIWDIRICCHFDNTAVPETTITF